MKMLRSLTLLPLLLASATASGADPARMDCARLLPADLVARHAAASADVERALTAETAR